MFCENGVVKKLHKTNKKTPMSESLKKVSLTQVIFCEFGEVFKNSFFTEDLPWLLLKMLHKVFPKSKRLRNASRLV